ncbi:MULTISPECIES: hypothetical protein [unclassified Nonomuraea]|uniref:hypothetical protein n=1 Tax=unclassified Nonomuraea TaxID=2593643 RepID=UPI0033D61BA5
MERKGASYSASQIKGLAGAMDDLAGRLRDVGDRYETHKVAIRKALGDDDYGQTYWRTHERLEAIGTALQLLTATAQREGGRLGQASANHRATDEANNS